MKMAAAKLGWVEEIVVRRSPNLGDPRKVLLNRHPQVDTCQHDEDAADVDDAEGRGHLVERLVPLRRAVVARLDVETLDREGIVHRDALLPPVVVQPLDPALFLLSSHQM